MHLRELSTMRAFYLFLTLVCAVQALRVPFLHVSRVQLSPSQRSSSSSVSESSSCQICGASSMMSPCSCAACSSSRGLQPSRLARRSQRLHMSTSGSTTTEPSPGSPVVKVHRPYTRLTSNYRYHTSRIPLLFTPPLTSRVYVTHSPTHPLRTHLLITH